MDSIFLSYRRDDASGHSGRIYDRLAQHFGEEKLFRDVDKINYGDDFVDAIDDAVGSCKALIAIISPVWTSTTDKQDRRRLDNPNDFVRIEIESALSSKVPIFPVLVNGAVMPEAEDLPESILPLARRHALEISDTRFDYDVDQLINALETKTGLEKIPVTETPALDTTNQTHSNQLELAPEFEQEPLPPSVKHKLSIMQKLAQLRFLDLYRRDKKSKSIAYLFLLLPLPIFGLHNLYLGHMKRQLMFWLVSGIPFVIGLYFSFSKSSANDLAILMLVACIWPIIDLFLLNNMVNIRNELIAQKIIFSETKEH